MVIMAFNIILFFLCILPVAYTTEPNTRVLALLENNGIIESHSTFFKILTDFGFSVSYSVADDANIVIKKYGAFLYDHLIIFSPTVDEFGGKLSSESILDFVDNGGNVFVAGSSKSGDLLREIASECGFELDEEGTYAIDHFNFIESADSGHHTLLKTTNDRIVDAPAIVPDRSSINPIVYRGTGLIVDRSNPLVIEILSATSTAYSHNPNKPINNYPHATGTNVALVAALQARNNARVIFTGSMEMFSDSFMNFEVNHKESGNFKFARAIIAWCFKLRGVLRTTKVTHHYLDPKTPTAAAYTIKDKIIYSIGIEEMREDRTWIPYKANDVQMEFVRIDPFVRITLVGDKNGMFSGKFQIPDVYGVYQFRVDYNRLGLTNILSTTQFSVIPLRHDQYERFIGSAFPYYASAFSMMAGVCIFSFVFLHMKDTELNVKAKCD